MHMNQWLSLRYQADGNNLCPIYFISFSLDFLDKMFKRISIFSAMILAVFLTACHPDPYGSQSLYGDAIPEGVLVPGARPTLTASLVPGDIRATGGVEHPARIERHVHARKGQDLNVVVDVSDQLMKVSLDGELAYQWPVSTAREGSYTPRGDYGVQWLSEFHKSSIYNDAPMPYSIFFNGDFAIHGTEDVVSIGRPASAGCVRLIPDDAAVLFEAVQAVGTSNVSIKITD